MIMAPHSSFNVRRHSARMLVLMGLIVVGCNIDEGAEVEPDMFDDVHARALAGGGGAGGDPDTHNTLDDNCLNLSGVVSTIQTLGQGPIANANHYLPSMPNMPAGNATSPLVYVGCRRELLTVIVECALHGEYTYIHPATNNVVVVPAAEVWDSGDVYRGPPRLYQGRHGLAPEWETRALTEDEQELVSACVMARTNAYGDPVQILMQGLEPLAYNEELRSQYTYGESIVWGNLFTQPRSMHVCHSPYNSGCLLNDKRICDEPQSNYCGFENHGDCLSATLYCSGSISPDCYAWPNRISVFLDASNLTFGCPAPITPSNEFL
jgi:hypothetical protein